MSNLSEAYGLNPHFWTAVDYKDDPPMLNEIHSTAKATYHDPPFRGHIALRFTFIEILSHMINHHYRHALLFEDDIVLQTSERTRFCSMHSFMQQVPADWDVVYFGFYHKGRRIQVNRQTVHVSGGRILCLHHWALTYKAAVILLKEFKDFTKRHPWRNPDEIVSDFSVTGILKTYRPNRTITIQQWFIQKRFRSTLPGRHRSDIDMS
jgi:GR25 family glycosyltransferase involved in LPS biosynthesis